MIIKTLLPILLCFIFIGIAYTNVMNASEKNLMSEKQTLVDQNKEPVKVLLSEEDKTLIEEYNRISNFI